MDIFINGALYWNSKENPNFGFSFYLNEIENLQPINELKIVFYDDTYNHIESVPTFGFPNSYFNLFYPFR